MMNTWFVFAASAALLACTSVLAQGTAAKPSSEAAATSRSSGSPASRQAAGTAKDTASDKSTEAPPVGSEPTLTTAVFGDWTVRCVRPAGAGERTCELTQSIMVEGQGAPLAQIAIGRAQPKAPLQLTLVLPNNVTLSSAPQASSGQDEKTIDLRWQRCLPGGCIADIAMSDDVLGRWRAQTAKGSISFLDGTGRRVTIPFSLRGLTQAVDAWAKG